MPYEPSFMSSNTLTQSIRRIASNGRPHIDIRLDQLDNNNSSSSTNNNTPSELHAFTTGDSLSGSVSITSTSTVRFDEVQITLEGLATTFIELMSPVAHQTRQQASHPFLRLSMPIPESAYPLPRIAEPGTTYTFPFHFVVPEHLLLSSCTHDCTGDEAHVRAAHLRLPPTTGGHQSRLDDLAPDMSQIQYSVRVRVLSSSSSSSSAASAAATAVLVDKRRPVRVIPAIPEAPPLHILPRDEEYRLSASKTLRKGVFKGKLGTLSLAAAQTKAIATAVDAADNAPTVLATVHLRFDPAAADARPPRLGSLASKIRASTFFSIRPVRDLPTRPNALSPYEISQRVYSDTVSLASRCMDAVEWAYHAPAPSSSAESLSAVPSYSLYERRDSGYSTASAASGSSASSGGSTILAAPTAAAVTAAATDGPDSDSSSDRRKGHWTAKILVPLTLPANKTWLPTFHTCIISRVYALDMSLTAHTPGTGVPATTLSVRLPLELISDPSGGASAAALAAAAGGISLEQQVDLDLAPRTLEPINPAFVARSGSIVAAHLRAGSVEAVAAANDAASDLPPGYEVFGRSVAVRT